MPVETTYSIIFIELFHIEILLIWTQSVYGHLKRCAHIASTVQNDGPDSRSKRGTGSIQSERSVLNSFAYVQQVSLAMEGNFRLPKLLVQFHHRNTLGGTTSWQELLKNVIQITGDVYQAHLWIDYTIDYTGHWNAMICDLHQTRIYKKVLQRVGSDWRKPIGKSHPWQ